MTGHRILLENKLSSSVINAIKLFKLEKKRNSRMIDVHVQEKYFRHYDKNFNYNRWFFKFLFSIILIREYEAFVAVGIK